MSTIIELSGVSVARGADELLSSVSFGLETGRCLAIVGETGAGKSLACRVLVGTLDRIGARIAGGTAFIDGCDLRTATKREWRALRTGVLGFVPQASLASLNPVRGVGSQLAEAWRLVNGVRPTRAQLLDALAAVELTDPALLSARPHELSGGMRQRVVIAMAILGRPRLLIADEPTTALDVVVQREVLGVLARLREELSMSMVLVTHDLGVVATEADDIAVLYAGMTVEAGIMRDVLRRPTHPYTRALLDAQPALSVSGERMPAIPGSPPAPQDWPVGCRFATRCPHAIDACRAGVPPAREWGAAWSRCIRTKEVLDV